jgi:hypothetical protein
MGGVRSVARAPASMERESEQNMEALFELCILLFWLWIVFQKLAAKFDFLKKFRKNWNKKF